MISLKTKFFLQRKIVYAIPYESDLALEIYNSIGIKVRTLVKGKVPAGFHKVQWDAKDDSGKPLPPVSTSPVF